MVSLSARNTAPNQMPTARAKRTSPMSAASGATQKSFRPAASDVDRRLKKSGRHYGAMPAYAINSRGLRKRRNRWE
jgi:hypothetical protein